MSGVPTRTSWFSMHIVCNQFHMLVAFIPYLAHPGASNAHAFPFCHFQICSYFRIPYNTRIPAFSFFPRYCFAPLCILVFPWFHYSNSFVITLICRAAVHIHFQLNLSLVERASLPTLFYHSDFLTVPPSHSIHSYIR